MIGMLNNGHHRFFLNAMASDLFSNPFLKIANFSLEGVTLGYLQPEKLHNVLLEAFTDKVSVWLYSGKIRALPTRTLVLVIMNALLSRVS